MNNVADIFAIINARIRPRKKKEIIAFLKENKIAYCETAGSQQAIELAMSSHAGIVIAVGGDGTIHEVVNGIDLEKQRILIVPAGSLNCLARSLGIKSIKSALTLVKSKNKLQRVDMIDTRITNADGMVHNRRIIGFASVGYDGLVVQCASKHRWVYAPLRYVLAGWIAASRVKKAKAELCINGHTGKTLKSFSSLLVNNGGANLFSTIKKWDMQDGLAEFQILKFPGLVHIFWAILSKSFVSGVFCKNTTNINMSCDVPLQMMADGELFENVISFSMEVRPAAVQLILPLNAKARR